MPNQPCPHCGEDSPDALEGVEIPDVHQGILIWHCFTCGKAWRRIFDNDQADLNQAARAIAIEWNRKIKAQR